MVYHKITAHDYGTLLVRGLGHTLASQRIRAQSAIKRFIVYLQFDVPKRLQQITLEDIQKVATECSFLRQFQISVKDNTNVQQALE